MNLPVLIYILLGLAGFGLLVAGVFLMQGLAWALIAGSAACFCLAGFLKKGMSSE